MGIAITTQRIGNKAMAQAMTTPPGAPGHVLLEKVAESLG